MKLSDIKRCFRCDSNNLKLKSGYNVWNPIMEIDEIFNVSECKDCKCVHFIQDGRLGFQFNAIGQVEYKVNHLKSDYEVAIMNK